MSLEFIKSRGQLDDLACVDLDLLRRRRRRGRDDPLQMQRARLHQLQQMREWPDLRGEQEDGQVVVRDQALGRAGQLCADGVQ